MDDVKKIAIELKEDILKELDPEKFSEKFRGMIYEEFEKLQRGKAKSDAIVGPDWENPDPKKAMKDADEFAELAHVYGDVYFDRSDQNYRRFIKASDTLYALKTVKGWSPEQARDTRYYRAFASAFENLYREKAAAYRGAAGVGLEWLPQGFSATLIEDVMAIGDTTQIFDSIPLGNLTVKVPKATAYPTTYRHVVGTAPTVSTDVTTELTFTTESLYVILDWEIFVEEDTVLAFQTVLSNRIAKSLARAITKATIDGQLTTIDTGYTIATTDPRKAWDGLRVLSVGAGANMSTNTNNVDFGAAFTSAKIRDMLGGLGKWGQNPREVYLLCGTTKTWKFPGLNVAGDEPFVPLAKMTVPPWHSGMIGTFDGVAIVPTEFLPNAIGVSTDNGGMNTVGIYTGVDTATNRDYTLLIACHGPSFLYGKRRGTEVLQDIQPKELTKSITITTRLDFQAAQTITDDKNGPVVVGYEVLLP